MFGNSGRNYLPSYFSLTEIGKPLYCRPQSYLATRLWLEQQPRSFTTHVVAKLGQHGSFCVFPMGRKLAEDSWTNKWRNYASSKRSKWMRKAVDLTESWKVAMGISLYLTWDFRGKNWEQRAGLCDATPMVRQGLGGIMHSTYTNFFSLDQWAVMPAGNGSGLVPVHTCTSSAISPLLERKQVCVKQALVRWERLIFIDWSEITSHAFGFRLLDFF